MFIKKPYLIELKNTAILWDNIIIITMFYLNKNQEKIQYKV